MDSSTADGSRNDVAEFIGKHFLPPANARTVCPPGTLRPGDRPLILAPTIPRSGTHLLIDVLLNNFQAYKRRPLYVDLDRLLEQEDSDRLVDRLAECRGYIVKTHYPHIRNSETKTKEAIEKLADGAACISTSRDLADVFRSAQSFGADVASGSEADFKSSAAEFRSFWKSYNCMEVPFEAILDRPNYPGLVGRIGDWIGTEPNDKVVYPFAKHERAKVYVTKAVTRILGSWSPLINTTIRFAKPS